MFPVKNYFNTTFDQKTKTSTIVDGSLRVGNHLIVGTLSQLAELASLKDDSYHIRINAEEDVIFFGDLDHYKDQSKFDNFLDDLSKDLEVKKDDIKYTVSKKENEYSYHFSVPKVQTNLETLKTFFSKPKYKKDGYDVDLSVYCNKWFRLPNQTNEQKPIKHTIVNGKMKHFIINNVENCKYTYYDKPKTKEKQNDKEYKKVEYEDVEAYTNMLSYSRADNYDKWIRTGLCLHNILDEEARELFHTFSKLSKKYNKDNVDKYFNTFKEKEHGGLTIGTLKYWAKEDNPEEYEKYEKSKKPKTNNNFWEMMALFNNSDLAEYYKDITIQRFIYCRNIWYGYDEYNVITKLSEKTPSQLISNISDVLKAKLKEEIKKIEPEDKIYESTYKLFKSCYKAVGTSSFVKGMIDYIQSYYNDDKLIEKIDNNSSLLAFTDKVYDFKINEFRNIEMDDFISITTGYEAPNKSDPKKQQEIKDIIYSVFENELMAKYWLESVSMAIHTNKFENFYIHTGSGRNGKGLLFSLIESALGKYISTADSEFLTTRIESGKPNPILTKAKGKRFMMITEPSTEDNKKNVEIKMNVDLIKKLSGLDKIEARDLFQKSESVIEYKPQFTCFLQCNQKPELGKLDNAMKERLKIIDYPFTFVDEPSQDNERKKDMNLKDKLASQDYINEVILLLIDTVKNFTKFNIPAKVFESNNDYFGSCDPVKEWLFNNYDITKDRNNKIRTSDLLKRFTSETNNHMVASKFNNYMKFHNINTTIFQGYNYFVGIQEKKKDLDL